jgi:hypothetical protein
MMTQELKVSVLAAPLAAIDRRALSQAWYSALHFAGERTADAPVRPRRSASQLAGAADCKRMDKTPQEAGVKEGARRRAHSNGGNARAFIGAERRASRSALARKIERTFLNPRTATQRATFAAAGKRVHVMLHASNGGVRLVAVCPPAIRETVARALAQARFALAARGVACS